MRSQVLQDTDSTLLLMGNEAIARGAIEGGVQLVAAYPGTPSSEIGEVLLDVSETCGFYSEWSTNEKIAFELAAGASLVGARSLTAMKNAGLNVAMDTFMTLPYGGCKGGFVIVVADDPDAHYSSTEQDTRLMAEYAEIPCLEPENQQEAKDMTREAFDISESLELPVFLRSVSRISHASGDVKFDEVRTKRNTIAFNKHYKLPSRWNVYGPPGALSKHIWLKGLYPKAREMAENSRFNKLNKIEGAKTVVIATGLGSAYAKDAMEELGLVRKMTFLKLGFIHPLPEKLITQAMEGAERILIVEEGDPVVENQIRMFANRSGNDARIIGKRYGGIFKPYGELNTDIIVNALTQLTGVSGRVDPKVTEREESRQLIIPRSSTLCAGCSHLGSYAAVREALRKHPGIHIVNGDIGCYEQGGYGIFSTKIEANSEDGKKYRSLSPYDVLDTVYVMGSGIGMAMGQVSAGFDQGKVLAVAGDSTFIHATMPSLVNAIYDDADITFLVLNNDWTCMTGHQPNPNTKYCAGENPNTVFDIETVCRAIGVRSIAQVSAYDRTAAVEAVNAALAFKGPSVVILLGECQLQLSRRTKRGMAKTHIVEDKCNGCKTCVQLGCPAIKYDPARKRASIDEIGCVDCGLCAQFCPQLAIETEGEEHGI